MYITVDITLLIFLYLRLRDTAHACVLTVYSKFAYARYNFHLKQS